MAIITNERFCLHTRIQQFHVRLKHIKPFFLTIRYGLENLFSSLIYSRYSKCEQHAAKNTP